MTEKKSPFYAHRYLVTPKSEQISIVQQLNESKEVLINKIISDLTFNTKIVWVKGSKRYLFYGYQNRDNIFIVKFARETKENIYVEGDDDIEIKGIKEAKFIFLIIDIEHQIVLVEKNSSVFQQVESAVNILAEYLRAQMSKYDYVVNIYPLVSKKKFWSYVESAEEIYELSLEMNAPNMPLFGNSDTRSVLEEIKKATNNEVLDITLKNKEGSLKILKDVLGSYIEYVREVGGKYLLKFMRNGTRETKTSATDTAITYIESKRTEKYTEKELTEISDKLTSIHSLESRDDYEDEEQ